MFQKNKTLKKTETEIDKNINETQKMIETINHFIKTEEAKDNASADDLNRYQNMLTKYENNLSLFEEEKEKKEWEKVNLEDIDKPSTSGYKAPSI